MRRTLSLSAAAVAAAASLTLAAPAEAAPAQTAAPVSAQDSIQVTGWSKWKTGKIKKPIKGIAASWKYHTRWITKSGRREKQIEIQFHLVDTASDKMHAHLLMDYKTWDGVWADDFFRGPNKKHSYHWWKGTPRSIKVRECVKGSVWGAKCAKKWKTIYNWNQK